MVGDTRGYGACCTPRRFHSASSLAELQEEFFGTLGGGKKSGKIFVLLSGRLRQRHHGTGQLRTASSPQTSPSPSRTAPQTLKHTGWSPFSNGGSPRAAVGENYDPSPWRQEGHSPVHSSRRGRRVLPLLAWEQGRRCPPRGAEGMHWVAARHGACAGSPSGVLGGGCRHPIALRRTWP